MRVGCTDVPRANAPPEDPPPRSGSPSGLTPGAIAAALARFSPDLAEVDPADTAGVLFLLQLPAPGGLVRLLLTKRSARVRQPGDLCCPGGGLHRFDGALGALLRLPGAPLARSPGWRLGAPAGRGWRQRVARYWACALRESWEELGLGPLGVGFLGVLPPYRLALFQRGILPLVGWVGGPRRLRPNWEVERVVAIDLAELLDPERHARYLLDAPWADPGGTAVYPCFLHRGADGDEVLWGATYQIALSFLERVFGFVPPALAGRPAVAGALAAGYAGGASLG